ncbi:MAG: hypothetical protein ACJA0J_000824 [Bdellovibrionota bacterium]|jgi:hypothetical protein
MFLYLWTKSPVLVRYSSEVEVRMQLYFGQLGEKDRRYYAAIEADKLGYGGLRYISQVLGLNEESIRNGIQELKILMYSQQSQEVSSVEGVVGGKKRSD